MALVTTFLLLWYLVNLVLPKGRSLATLKLRCGGRIQKDQKAMRPSELAEMLVF